MTARLPQDGPAPEHQVRIEDGRFASAHCACGWRSAGRRDRRLVREEARDHALLYAGSDTADQGPTDGAAATEASESESTHAR